MRWFKKKEDPEKKLLNSFLGKLGERGFNIIVFDKKQIKEKYGHGLFNKLFGTLAFLRYKKLLFIFDMKEPRISWISHDYPDRIVINLAHSPGTLEFQKAIQKSLKEMLELESVTGNSKTQRV